MENIKRTTNEKIMDAIILALVSIIVLIIFYPLWFVIVASVSNVGKIYDSPFLIMPVEFNLSSFRKVLENADIWVGYRNTIFYTFLGTSINLVLTVFGAYPLSRKDFYGRGFFTFLITFTMFFSGGMIPTYLIIKNLGIVNSAWSMVLPGAINVYNLIVMRTYFQTRLPMELQEAAFIDGCSNIKLLFAIALPLSMPIIAVMLLFYGVAHWNAYFNALLYITSKDKYPLQMFLREMLIKNEMEAMLSIATDEGYAMRMQSREGLKYAVIVVSSIPMLVIYPFLQKFFEKGIMVGALKG